MDLELKNKRVLITGASRGIGFAASKAFLAEGAKVNLVSRGTSNLEKAKKKLSLKYGINNLNSYECDCRDIESLLELERTINIKDKGLDIVVANIGDGRSVDDVIPSLEQWNRTWDSNFETALNTARTFLPMLKKSNGCLLFISSIAGIESIGAPVDYSTAKTAVIALAKNMARKLGKEVRVNVLAPGNVYFPGGSWDDKIKSNNEHVEKIIQSTVPMQRFGTPEEMADAILFLCSDRAKFITGTVLVVDGGQTSGIL